jgi:hypothetical protein
MIWFGNLPGFPPAPPLAGRAWATEYDRMQQALQWVAARAPHLCGEALLDAVADTGWLERATARRLLPHFNHFDPDRYFAENLRKLSFRGPSVADEFRAGVGRVVEDLTGIARFGDLASESAIRFAHGEREGIVLAYPEVGFTINGATRVAVGAAVEEMPDVLVIVARNFQEGAAAQLGSILSGTEVPGTLVTVNLLLGIRATALRYQPATDRVLDLLGMGRPIRSADVARLGDRF